MSRYYQSQRAFVPPSSSVSVSVVTCTPSTQACAKEGDQCTTAESCSSGLKYVYRKYSSDTVKCMPEPGNVCVNPSEVFRNNTCQEPPQPQTPTTTTPTNYIKHEGKVRWTSVNTDVAGGSLTNKTLNECKTSCNQNAECAGFSREARLDNTKARCWLKTSTGVVTNEFSIHNNFNMYVKGGAPPQTTPTPTTTTPTNYIKHEGKVRWTSVNTDVAGGSLTNKTLNECKTSCNQNAECAGFSREARLDNTKARCWLKTSTGVVTNEFSIHNNFNMYVKGGAPPQTPISTPPPPQTTPTQTTGKYTKIVRKANMSTSVREGNAGWGTLDKCERDCDSRPACKGFIRHNINNSDGSSGSCWFVGQAGVTNIPNNTPFNTYVKPRSYSYTKKHKKIKFTSNGTDVPGGYLEDKTLEECKAECNKNTSCAGFSRQFSRTDRSKCWLKTSKGVTGFASHYLFNTYVKNENFEVFRPAGTPPPGNGESNVTPWYPPHSHRIN